MRRMLMAVAAVGALAASSPSQVEARKADWCGLYCDTIYIGCKKTVGWLDREACDEWHDGCLDGCEAGRS